MDFLSEEERENLILEYKHLHNENWQRGHGIWLVNSILITGSLIVAFRKASDILLDPVVSLMLVVTAVILHASGEKITTITYNRMEEIRKILGMTGATEMYKSRIRGTWWHIVRTNAAHVLFIFLIGIYLFLLEDNTYLLLITFSTGFIILLIKETYALSRRIAEKQQL
jgi:hypothetical protein